MSEDRLAELQMRVQRRRAGQVKRWQEAPRAQPERAAVTGDADDAALADILRQWAERGTGQAQKLVGTEF
jgi:hypothetical protein